MQDLKLTMDNLNRNIANQIEDEIVIKSIMEGKYHMNSETSKNIQTKNKNKIMDSIPKIKIK